MNDSYSSSISPAVMVDGVGNYELSLSPGDYAIGALHFNSPDYYWYNDSTSEVGYQMQFFENASTIEGATVIQVAEGGELGILILILSMVKFLDLTVIWEIW